MCRTGNKSHNVGQALVTSKPSRRHRNQDDSGKGDRAGQGVTVGAAAAKNSNQQQYELSRTI